MSAHPILIVSRSLPMHQPGGMEIVAWDLARTLAATVGPVTVLTTRLAQAPAEFSHAGVSISALPGTEAGRYSASWWRASRRAFRRRYAGRVAAVISVSAGAFALLPLRSESAPVPFLMQAHGTALRDAVSAWHRPDPRAWAGSLRSLSAIPRDLRAYPRFDRVVAVGPAIAEALQRPPASWVLPPEKVVTIPNGVDPARFAPDPAARQRGRARHGFSPDNVVVVSSSRLHRQKGVLEGLAGFARFAAAEPAARLLVVGGGPARKRMQRAVSDLRLTARVHFAGALPHEEMPTALCAADLFLFTTRHPEGAPLAILEALACGLPAVVSDHLREPLRWGPAVRGADPRDPQAICAALQHQRPLAGQTRSWLPPGHSLTETARGYATLLAAVRAGG
ncbi:MAG: glycosyltransferase family 4 protein [Candidatus Eisenbacteria sp.]|nr:glycosyltransferase family 4 protein [Candidatus Eisenbacteria bacterium]